MRQILHTLLQILDGTPAEYGKLQRGQSVIEMAFITPVLIILVAGTMEVGWFANNYLILLEATRVGARQGTVLEGSDTPLAWEANPALVAQSRVTTGSYQETRDCDLLRDANLGPGWTGFYNLVGCLIIRSINPIEFDALNGQDDIVISAFSIAVIPDTAVLPSGVSGVPRNTPRVVARYPANANECTNPAEARDPFDFYNIGSLNDGELVGFDGGNEDYRGFSWTGAHLVTVNGATTACRGSQFSSADIEQRFALSTFGTMGAAESRNLPSQGMVLVELYWQHELLLAFPAFSPLYTMLGEQTTLGVWAAFPVPSIEPRINFDCPPPNVTTRPAGC